MTSLRDNLRTSGRLFRNGNYTQCQYVLSNLKTQSKEESLPEIQLLVDINSIVCDLVMPNRKAGITFETCYKQMKEFRERIQNIGYDSNELQLLHVIVVCNMISILLFEVSRTREMIITTWESFLHTFGNVNIENAERLNTKIYSIYEKLKPESRLVFLYLCCHMTIFYLLEKKFDHAKKLLSLVFTKKSSDKDRIISQRFVDCCIHGTYRKLSRNENNFIDTLEDYISYCKMVYCLVISEGDYKLLDLDFRSMLTSNFQIASTYIKAMLNYKMKKYEEFNELCDVVENFAFKDSYVEACCRNLLGCFFSRMDKHELAIQQFSLASEANNDHLVSLYNLFLEHGRLNAVEDQVQVLLRMIKHCDRIRQEATMLSLTINTITVISPEMHFFRPVDMASAAYVYYTLAEVYMGRKWYHKATTAYYKALSILTSSDCDAGNIIFLPKLPPMKYIYHTLAYALLLVGRFCDAVSSCDKTIAAHITHDTLQCEDFSCFSCDIIGLMLKCYLLFKLEDHTQSLAALHVFLFSALQGIKKIDDVSRTTTNSGNDSMKHLLKKVCGFAYNCKALIMIQKNNLPDALHNMCKAVNSDPDNIEIQYNYALLLMKMEKFEEAFEGWLKFQRTNHSGNTGDFAYDELTQIATKFFDDSREITILSTS